MKSRGRLRTRHLRYVSAYLPGGISVNTALTAVAIGLWSDSGMMPPMKYPEIVADKLHASGWSWVYCCAVTADGWRWIVDAHREGGRYIVRSDELLSAF